MIWRIKLPPAFVSDCLESDCDVGDYANGILTANDAQLVELISRARHYAHGGLDRASFGLSVSARATLRAIQRETA